MAKKRSNVPGGVPKRRGRRSKLSAIPTFALQAELKRRASSVSMLQKHRDALAAQLASVEAELSVLTGDSFAAAPAAAAPRRRGGRRKGGGGRGGRRREGSLAMTLHKILQGKSMSVTEAVEAIKAAGYASDSPNLRVMANQQLISKKNSDLFRRVKRGVYTAR
ncbi:MAG: hypothetical protein HRU76_06530 [Phycisphaeraceae bacterium]|nr:hypothetical protein [Phycisphaerales bacterium]QOJ17248.1 MAG: hypothetical protein HRU76_06530 [Phycisphaeraceae bacterium]